MLLRVEGLRSIEQAMHQLGTGEHIWVRGIGDVLIYVCRLGESSFRVGVYSVERIATRFSVKRLRVDARVGQMEAYKLMEKLSARPCRVVKNTFIDGHIALGPANSGELSYRDFVIAVKDLGLRVQANP